MAFSGVFRRTASALSPLALRAIRARTALQNPSSARELCRTLVIHNSPFSSLAKNSISNDHLLTVIDSEIKCALESDNHNQIDGIPNGFPFELQDNPGQQTVTLRREYGGEVITVEVYMPDLVTGDEGGNDDDDDSKSGQSSIPLVVSVSKGDGPCLEFGCTAYPDEVAIDSMSVKDSEAPEDQIAYEGPDFSDLDENLQKGFHKYLEIRGIKASTTNFLHEYMINKDSREYLNWLKNLKNFIGK